MLWTEGELSRPRGHTSSPQEGRGLLPREVKKLEVGDPVDPR